jgi:UDPglucose 6-dehydrogenase
LQAAGRACGYEALLGPRVIAVNDAVPERIFARIRQGVPAGAVVALFGVAYKRDTHIVEESQAIILAKHLLEDGYSVRLHDPLALDAARAELGEAVAYCVAPHDAAQGAACIALLTDSPEFAAYDWPDLERSAAPGALLLDVWRLLRGRRFDAVRHAPLGIGGRPGT